MASETTELRWFEQTDRKCSCGARASGILRGSRNESYGPHCKRCADRRLKASEKARAALASRQTKEPARDEIHEMHVATFGGNANV